MENILFLIILALLVAVLVKLFVSSAGGTRAELIDLKNQITDLKTAQLENQTKALANQQEAFNAIIKTVNENLAVTQSNINKQLFSSGQTINDVQKKLGSLSETTKNIQKIGEDISSLQDILQSPKLRGNLGEYLLEDLLSQMFTKEHYGIKHSFKNGTQVDCIIKLGGKIIPVDAKFPLESFTRLIQAKEDEEKKKYKKEFISTVKERIDEIADKYINPDEGTFDFALMYIPAENVFYELIVNDALSDNYEIFNYAVAKHVVPVSPNSFYAYLMAIAYGLQGFKIEKEAQKILGELSAVQERFSKFYSSFTLVGKHISNASSKYDESAKRAEKVNYQISKLTGNKTELAESGEGALIEEE